MLLPLSSRPLSRRMMTAAAGMSPASRTDPPASASSAASAAPPPSVRPPPPPPPTFPRPPPRRALSTSPPRGPGPGPVPGVPGLSDDDLRSRLDDFNDKFAEARMSIEDCADAADTTYFDEEADAAREAVDEAVGAFESILAELDDDARGRVIRQNGLKVEQLRGELELVLSGGHH